MKVNDENKTLVDHIMTRIADNNKELVEDLGVRTGIKLGSNDAKEKRSENSGPSRQKIRTDGRKSVTPCMALTTNESVAARTTSTRS